MAPGSEEYQKMIHMSRVESKFRMFPDARSEFSDNTAIDNGTKSAIILPQITERPETAAAAGTTNVEAVKDKRLLMISSALNVRKD